MRSLCFPAAETLRKERRPWGFQQGRPDVRGANPHRRRRSPDAPGDDPGARCQRPLRLRRPDGARSDGGSRGSKMGRRCPRPRPAGRRRSGHDRADLPFRPAGDRDHRARRAGREKKGPRPRRRPGAKSSPFRWSGFGAFGCFWSRTRPTPAALTTSTAYRPTDSFGAARTKAVCAAQAADTVAWPSPTRQR